MTNTDELLQENTHDAWETTGPPSSIQPRLVFIKQEVTAKERTIPVSSYGKAARWTTETARFMTRPVRGSVAEEVKKMPEKETIERAEEDAREGKSPSTQAGEFVREEIDHVREGKHGARSAKQAIAIGLSKARRAGVDLPAPKPGKASKE